MATDSLRIFNKNLADKLIAEAADENEIPASCFSEDEIHRAYYGSFAHLGNKWENAISSSEFFPDNEDGETFLLLRSEHVDEILNSFREHSRDLSVMTGREIATIAQWQDLCRENEGFVIAYCFDF